MRDQVCEECVKRGGVGGGMAACRNGRPAAAAAAGWNMPASTHLGAMGSASSMAEGWMRVFSMMMDCGGE